MAVYTIGYEGIDQSDFLSLLSSNDIDEIIDIREFPISRKPGFSKSTLSKNLAAADIGYQHIVRLGCPKEIRNAYRVDSSWSNYKKEFQKYLNTQQEIVSHLARLSYEKNFALLCFEADPYLCHRSIVAKAISKITNIQCTHIEVKKAKTG